MDLSRITRKDTWNPIEPHSKRMLLLIVVCSCVVFVPPIAVGGAVVAGVNWYIFGIPVFMFGVLASLLHAMMTEG